jgi:glyoxylase-like metal-dependent hydrolase (beta-lactamase superfamily II)
VAWEVCALRYGTLRSTRSAQYLRWATYGEPDGRQDLDYFFWLLRDGTRTVVVDTGFSPAAARRRGREMLLTPARALAGVGVDPREVDTLVLTHLHFDHVGNVGLFAHARVLAPGSELDFWSGPVASRPQLADHIETDELEQLRELERTGRLERFDGDGELLEGVRAIALPGHSPGQHGLLVSTDGRPVLLVSDAVHFYAELETGRPYSILTDLPAMHASYDRIRALMAEHDAALVVGHDPEVASRFDELPTEEPSLVALRIV